MAGRMILGKEMGHVSNYDGALHVSTTETATLIRAALKRAFPGQKFSVRSDKYANGSSIRVRWTDGPLASAVEEVARPYGGSSFDPMIDLKYGLRHWLMPDGSIAYAVTGGAGSTNPEQIFDPPSPDAMLANFSVDFVFCEREASPERTAECRRDLEQFAGVELPDDPNELWRCELPVKVWRASPGGWGDGHETGALVRFVDSETESAATLIRQLHATRSYA